MDRARRFGGVAVLVLALLAVAPPLAAQGGCGAVETTPDEGHLHLLGDAPPPVGYRSRPPASGWHYRERDRVRLGVAPADEPLTEPEQVSVLAVGGVVISYRDLDPGDVDTLAGVVAAAGERPVALTAYDALDPGEVALSAWRTVQRCEGVDPVAVEAFVEARAAPAPDFAMSGDDHDHADEPLPAGVQIPPERGPRLVAPATWPPWALWSAGSLLLAGFALAVRRTLRAPGPAAPREGREAV